MKKQPMSALLTLCILLALLPVTVQAADTGFVIQRGELVEYTGPGGAVTIPDSVTRIGDSAFFHCSSLTGVTIPDSVTSIGKTAFYRCDSLTGLTIPDSVTSIGDSAFSRCSSLKSVTIPDSVTSIGPGAFSDCDSLKDVYYSGSEREWKQITIEDNNRPLTKAAIHYGRTSREADIKWVYINGNLTIDGTGSMDDLILSTPPWDEYSDNIQTIRIANGVTSISANAFLFYSSLTRVTIPDSVTSIGTGAFMGCSSLTGVTIPSGVATIEDGVFMWCSRLTSVTVPDSVTYIGEGAFQNCSSLTDVYYSGSESQWKKIFIDESNGPLTSAVIHYNSNGPGSPSTPAAPSAPAAPSTGAVLSPQKLSVDGKDIACEKYNIGGSNYFKLRDLAQVLNGTGSQFGVGFDAAASTVSIATGEAYESTGTELATGVDNSATAQPSSQSIVIDGEAHGELTVYNIGGSNFFQLRELGNLLGFEVDYDAASNTAIVHSAQK